MENMPFVFDRLCNMFSFVRIVLVLEFEIIIVSYLDLNFVILNLFNELNMTLKWYGTFHNNSNLYRFANSQNKSVFQYLLVHSKSRSIYQLASVSFIDPFIETSTDQHYRRRTLVIKATSVSELDISSALVTRFIAISATILTYYKPISSWGNM